MKYTKDDDLIVRLIDLVSNDVGPFDQLARPFLSAWTSYVRHAGNQKAAYSFQQPLDDLVGCTRAVARNPRIDQFKVRRCRIPDKRSSCAATAQASLYLFRFQI